MKHTLWNSIKKKLKLRNSSLENFLKALLPSVFLKKSRKQYIFVFVSKKSTFFQNVNSYFIWNFFELVLPVLPVLEFWKKSYIFFVVTVYFFLMRHPLWNSISKVKIFFRIISKRLQLHVIKNVKVIIFLFVFIIKKIYFLWIAYIRTSVLKFEIFRIFFV